MFTNFLALLAFAGLVDNILPAISMITIVIAFIGSVGIYLEPPMKRVRTRHVMALPIIALILFITACTWFARDNEAIIASFHCLAPANNVVALHYVQPTEPLPHEIIEPTSNGPILAVNDVISPELKNDFERIDSMEAVNVAYEAEIAKQDHAVPIETVDADGETIEETPDLLIYYEAPGMPLCEEVREHAYERAREHEAYVDSCAWESFDPAMDQDPGHTRAENLETIPSPQ